MNMIFHYSPKELMRQVLMKVEGVNLCDVVVKDYKILFKQNRHGIVEEIRIIVEVEDE